VQQDTKSLDMLVSKMQAMMFAATQENNKAKITALKVHSSSKKKKQRTPVKTSLVGMLDSMKEEGMEALSSMGIADV
jgi:hypothetical protein